MNYEDKRKTTHLFVRIVSAALSDFVFFLTYILIKWLASDELKRVLATTRPAEYYLELRGFVVQLGIAFGMPPNYAGLIFLLPFGVVLYFTPIVRNAAANLADSVFDDFDESLFDRVKAPRRLTNENEPAPPLIKPEGSNAAEVFSAIIDFVRQGAEDNTGSSLMRRQGVERPFDWTIVTGRPGSGKSRIVTEAARTLARRDLLGGGAKKGALSLRFWSWFREEFPLMRRRLASEPDPWDAGYLRADLKDAKLEKWRPRKPTVVIMDDPAYGYAANVLRIFAGESAEYRKPVRVLVVNQTVSSELHAFRDQHVSQFCQTPIIVDQAAILTVSDISVVRAFVFALIPLFKG